MLDLLNYIYTLLLLQVGIAPHVGLWGQAVDIAVGLFLFAFVASFVMAIVSAFKPTAKTKEKKV